MVAKISLGNSLYGAIVYNGEKINKENGRLLDTNKIYNDGSGHIDIKRAFADFMQWMPTTTKTERPMVHISLNPHPDDILSDAQLSAIAREYMEKMGFGDMPYMVYKHTDINRHHMHIVALRVKTDGTCISDKNNFYRSKEITRGLEKKYGLKTAEREKVTPDTPLLKIDPSGDLKKQVAAVVKIIGMRYKFQTIGEYNAVLNLFNVKCENTDGRVNGREYHGLVYFALDDNGNIIAAPFKASRLGKFARRDAIDAKYERAKEKIDVAPTKLAVSEALGHCHGKEDFIARLKEKNIDVMFRYTEDGRIYGATFIDHNTMTVLNGSRMGKAFSANALNARFNQTENEATQQPVINQPQPDTRFHQQDDATGGSSQSSTTTPPTGHSQAQSHAQAPASNSNSSDFDTDGILPGLDLFQLGPSVNPDEEDFVRRHRRRKRGPRR
ncbi:conjugal transfer protein MobB [uncultured Duncaniella sp.]|uniref:conjugal transfer protein MobB n=1 Tax=uncultured Duncaniella sp. TaxID=2768039 RepID=UPI00272D90DE|nr:conjugal transfer protein MobB [uncultured Duncaniella sp.]